MLRQTEYHYGANGLPERIRVHSGGSVQEKAYAYDGDGRLVRAAENHHISSFDYDGNGRLSAQYSRSTETTEPSLPPTPWDDARYDPLYFGQTRNQTRYYTPAGYLSQLQLPDQRRLGWLYYGNGHLHHINLDGYTVSDIERDALHRETQRSQGSLHSSYSRDPIGRLQKRHTAAAGHTVLSGGYIYDRNGNLIESRHPDSGITRFAYDPLGRIQSATAPRIGLAQTFHYDPAHNLIDTPNTDPVHDNRIGQYQNNHYHYDTFGNTVYRELADGTQHTYTYDLFDRMVSVRIDHPDNHQPQIWHYRYDALNRRIAKWRQTEVSDSPQTDKVTFVWDGSRLLQEVHQHRTHTYVYTEADSYEPLAQITDYTDPNQAQEIHYFHCDQIGIPREMSDEAGNIVWRGQYDAWGKLLHEEKADGIHQPFRLQNQYYDKETGLHYNFFRYYDPLVGRFTQQDPIGLAGGDNLYRFEPNVQGWVDPLGLESILYVMTNENGTFIGDHAGLAVINTTKPEKSFIYDPAGSYSGCYVKPSSSPDKKNEQKNNKCVNSNLIREGDLIPGNIDLNNYIFYQKETDGNNVFVHKYNISDEQAEKIRELAIDGGVRMGGFCAASISHTLRKSGIIKFKKLDTYYNPKSLGKKLRKIGNK